MKRVQSTASILFVCLLSICLFDTANARQTGAIAGTVVDAETGETLIGANVVIDGTLTGTTTDLDGWYRIANLQPGTYAVKFSFIGFDPVTATDVDVRAGEITTVDASLNPESFEMGEVVVEARMMRNNEASLLRERQRSNAVSDAISAEAISRSGSSTAADAMEKVTGATVVDGKYVFVRGLGERYSSTHLNGVELPSSDPDKKAVHFDLFPAGMLDNIVTIKTFTPDKPGNFSGGLVDLGTKSYPEQLSITFSTSSSFNTQTHFGNEFLAIPGGDLNPFGFNNGLFDLPGSLTNPEVIVPNAVEARRDDGLAQNLDALSRSFNPYMAPIRDSAPINSKTTITIGNETGFVERPLGFVLSLTHNRSSSSYDGGDIGRYSFTGSSLTPDLLLNDARSKQEVSLGGMAAVNYKFTPVHELNANVIYSRSTEAEARFQDGTWPKELGDDEDSIFLNRSLKYTERNLYSFQLGGEHHFAGAAGLTAEWSGSIAGTTQDEPDTRFFASTRRVIGGTEVLSTRASGFSDPSRYFRNLEEDSRSLKVDLSLPFRNWAGDASKLKWGGAVSASDRMFRERIFSYVPNQPFSGDELSYFSEENVGIIGFDDRRGTWQFGNIITDASKRRNNYDGDRGVNAAYAMLELPLTSRLKFIGGARLESTDISVSSQDTTRAAGSLDEINLLPSANLVVKLTDDMNVRAAFTQTLARPTFREIAPFESFDFILSNFRSGNPELDLTRIANADLRWEWFRRPGELLAVSVFYKDMRDAIEQVIIGGTNGQLQFQNVDQATLLGAEFEVRTGLGFLPLLENVSVGTNASLVESSVDIAETELMARRAVDPDAESTRELQGQSPFIVNSDLAYDNPDTRTTVAVYFNVFGRRLSNVSLGGTPDVYEQPSPQLDFTFSQGIGRQLTVKASVKNLLDPDIRETYQFDDTEYIYSAYNKGRSISLGLSYAPY